LRRWQLASFALFFGLWELAGRWPVSPAFPPFSSTFLALVEMLRDGSLGKAYWITAQPLILGVVLCAIAGIGFGIGMGLSRTVEWLSLPVFIILQAAPMAAIIPLLTYMYGIGILSKVLAVVVLAAPVIVMNSYKGIRNTNPSLMQMCRAFLGTKRQEVLRLSEVAGDSCRDHGSNVGKECTTTALQLDVCVTKPYIRRGSFSYSNN
jgi:NitT/TauT family transport system permease protein